MARYVALLRGINLGRNRRIGMADLRDALTDAGYEEVRTLGQSGNVVLDAPGGRSADAVADQVERAIADRFGMESRVVVRTPRQLAAVVERDPLGDVADDPRLYLVHFLSDKPAAAALRSLKVADVAPEVFAAHGRELYSWHPSGQQRSPLAKLIADTDLGVVVTNRNWNTVTKLLALADG
jgi:uncharacterized protein (DUF1697 family)